jgi:acyl-CoA synthetase (AMP-forming)/AMP-acid ligase II
MTTAWQRFAYVCEFLLAAIAIFDTWSQIGGQAHLDMMPWYWKLGLGCGLAAVVVRMTAAMMSQERAWNRRAVMWAAAALALIVGMAAVTYYYHLQEVIEEPATEEDTTARIQPACRFSLSVARDPSPRPS